MFLSGSTQAGSEAITDASGRRPEHSIDDSIHLAQADTSMPAEEDDDIYFSDEMMDELYDEPYDSIADPLEPVNRAFYHFNDKLYFWVLKPAAKGYGAVIPEPARRGVKNFFNNISFPVRFVNCVLQGKFEGAGYEFGRFMINSTIGVAGFMDRATSQFKIPEYDEDLGQTLGSYGIGHGFFLNLPFFGPSSLTDAIGSAGDMFLEPINYLDLKTKYDLSIAAFETVNKTSLRIGEYEALKKAALDPYIAYRDAYYQYRQSQIKK
ncbi:MAG: VacJ family lipoprotein [Deltaproteobacteria bacterium]|nr:VacJ family lipoprotein [Deltaproteobacteria bacterium]